MNKKWWYIYILGASLCTTYVHSAPFVHVDLQQVQQHTTTIKNRAKKYQYIRYALRTGVAVSALYVLSTLFYGERTVSLEQVKELTKKCPCIMDHVKHDIPEVTLPQNRGISSWMYSKIAGLAKGSAHMGIFLAQQLMAFRLFEVLNIKMETLIRYPGSLDWFVEHQTDLPTLFDEYQEKADLLTRPNTELKSTINRAKEFITSQWHYLVNAVEQVLGYIAAIQEKQAVDTQECSTIISYITNCTNEAADIMMDHLDDHDTTLVANMLKQFKAELTSLLRRFDRLKKE